MSTRHLLPIGAKGELFLEGPSLAEGYLNDTATTEASFTENPAWLPIIGTTDGRPRRVYSTKDLVRYCPDGSLEYLGRVSNDTQVKLGGQRVELSEIEIQLAQMSTQVSPVPEFVIVLPKLGPLSGRLAAVFASDEGENNHDCIEVELMQFRSRDVDVASSCAAYLRTRLPQYMIPSIWVAVAKLPVTPSGKRNRTAILQKLESLTKREASDLCHHVTLRNAQENSELVASQQPKHNGEVGTRKSQESEGTHLLRLACSRVLQIDIDRVPGEGYSFIRLGGDSIAAMRVSTNLRQTASLKVSVRDLMTCSSLHEVASEIEYTAGRQPPEGVTTETKLNKEVNCNSSSKPIPQNLLAQIVPRVHSSDNIAHVYPCTPMQTSLLLSQSRMPGEAVYRLSMAWKVSCPTAADGLVDPDRLEAAWNQVVQRHSALRTVIVEESSAFYQVVLRHYRALFPHLQLENERHVAQIVLSHQPVKEAAVVPTKATCARPAYRVVVYSVRKTRELYFRLDINHVLLDGLSALNILRDVSTAYRSLAYAPESPLLPPLSSSSTMRDFVSYITEPGRREESLAYWKEYLVGAEACIFPRLVDGCLADADREEMRRADPVSLPISMQDISFPELGMMLSENEATLASLFLLVWSIVLRTVGSLIPASTFTYMLS